MIVIARVAPDLQDPTLPAGSDRTISIRVKPTKTGPVRPCRHRQVRDRLPFATRVLEPKLKVDVVANPTTGKSLEGPAGRVQGHRHEPGRRAGAERRDPGQAHPGPPPRGGSKSDDPILYELTLPELLPGHSEKLDTLVADAVVGGEQSCTVIAKSPDVVFDQEDAQVTKTISVVEPKLKLTVRGPTRATPIPSPTMRSSSKTPARRPARKIRVIGHPADQRQAGGKLPPDARFDATTRSSPGRSTRSSPRPNRSPFRSTSAWGESAATRSSPKRPATAGSEPRDRRTEVAGMPDVDLVVSESKRVLDSGADHVPDPPANYGTKDATNIQVHGHPLRQPRRTEAGGGSKDVKVAVSPKKNAVKFEQIRKLGPGKEMVLGIL